MSILPSVLLQLARLALAGSLESDASLPASPLLSTLAGHAGVGISPPSLVVGLTGGTRAVRFDLELTHGSEWLYVDYPQERTSAALLLGLPLSGATALWAGPGWAKGVRHGRPTGESEIGYFGAGVVPLYEKDPYSEAVLALRATVAWTVRDASAAASVGTRFGLDLDARGRRTWLFAAEVGFGRIGHGLLLSPAADSSLERFLTRPIRTRSPKPRDAGAGLQDGSAP